MSFETSPPPASLVAKLTPMAADAWHALSAQMYPGELSVATKSGVYRFKGGVFQGRAAKHGRTFDCPKHMLGMRLIGFVHEVGGLWALSPRWREGSHAVLWTRSETEEQAYLVTSPTHEHTREELAPKPAQGATAGLRRPIPGSTTRIHVAALNH